MVIALVTADADVLSGKTTSLDINTTTSTLSSVQAGQNHEILLSLSGSFNSPPVFDNYHATQPVRLYADPETNIIITYCIDPPVMSLSPIANIVVSISGYLVDVQ